MAGEIADFTDFSFHAVKNFTTAEGGASTWRDIPGIDNEEIYKQFQLYSLHGQSKDALAKTQLGAWEYDIVGPWYKCNIVIEGCCSLSTDSFCRCLFDTVKSPCFVIDSQCSVLHIVRNPSNGMQQNGDFHFSKMVRMCKFCYYRHVWT